MDDRMLRDIGRLSRADVYRLTGRQPPLWSEHCWPPFVNDR